LPLLAPGATTQNANERRKLQVFRQNFTSILRDPPGRPHYYSSQTASRAQCNPAGRHVTTLAPSFKQIREILDSQRQLYHERGNREGFIRLSLCRARAGPQKQPRITRLARM